MPVYRKSMDDFGQTLILLAQMFQQDRMRKEFAANAFRNEQTVGPTKQIPLGGAFPGETASMPTAGPMTQTPNYQAILSGLFDPNTQGMAKDLMQGLALMPKIQDPYGLREFTAKEEIRTGFNLQEAQGRANIPPRPDPLFELRKKNLESQIGAREKEGLDKTLVRQNKQILGELERTKRGLEARILAKYAGKINLDKILSGEVQIPTEPVKKWDSISQEMIDTGETMPDKLVLDWLDIIAQHESEMKGQGLPFVPTGRRDRSAPTIDDPLGILR